MLLHHPLLPLKSKPATKALRTVRESRMPVALAVVLKSARRALVIPKNKTMATM